MKNYNYENSLISKKELRNILSWSFTTYDSMQACNLADSLKYLGFKYASKAGISISIEDLKVPFVKTVMLEKANQDIINAEKIYLKGKLTDVERFQKIIDTWSLTSESLKNQVIYYFKNYDPLNSVYIMAFSGARGNLSQVRQLVGMRGLMSDPSGQIMNLPIKKNFREGLSITDYLMSGYGARKGIVDTALKTANSGYLTRRLIDVAQDILIREKDCLTQHSFIVEIPDTTNKKLDHIYDQLIGRVLIKTDSLNFLGSEINKPVTRELIKLFKQKNISKFYIRSPLTCNLYRAVCQKCYGWDLANENLIDIGESVGILAGQSIGEPGTQLTMRTFHTGGIFTSEVREQIISPISGIIKFSQFLKLITLRTNRGEDVRLTKNSGSLILIPTQKNRKLVQLEVARNTILFPKNNQYIQKDKVLGELINANKQIRNEIKPIISYDSGEIFVPSIKNQTNLLNANKLIWLLSGQLYTSPRKSFINFYPDCKINKSSFIFRTKILNYCKGSSTFIQIQENSLKRAIGLKNVEYYAKNAKLKVFVKSFKTKRYVLDSEEDKYLLYTTFINKQIFLQKTIKDEIGQLLTNTFRTLTGGTNFYDQLVHLKFNYFSKNIRYYSRPSLYRKKQNQLLASQYRSLIWLEEETQTVNCEPSVILVKDKDFISEKFEIIPGRFSKSSGLVSLTQTNNLVRTINIKCGLVYEGQQFIENVKKFYYPGEQIFSSINIDSPSLCEIICSSSITRLLIRPIKIYEFPYKRLSNQQLFTTNGLTKSLNFNSKVKIIFKSNQLVKTHNSVNLVSELLTISRLPLKNLNIQLSNNRLKNQVEISIHKNLDTSNYVTSMLKYKALESCFIAQSDQFIDRYSILGFIESTTEKFIEIVKCKVNKQEIKQILLISNRDCKSISTLQPIDKDLNDFVINSSNINEMGRILIKNDNFLTIQIGKPYFFPNCKLDSFSNDSTLTYKFLPIGSSNTKLNVKQLLSLNVSNLLNLNFKSNLTHKKFNLSKFFLKNSGKLYSCLIPRFLKKFSISQTSQETCLPNILKFQNTSIANNLYKKENVNRSKVSRTILIKSKNGNNINLNKSHTSIHDHFEFAFVQFLEYPFKRSTKRVGLYSITEDYFEQESNSVFCRNNEFIEEGRTIGLLNLEKEITGDIVQGLPRIEEILEARKQKSNIKRLPTSKKRGLLIQKTNLDTNFEFRKLGTVIKENEKVNPHRLLKVYFNYYGTVKSLYCENKLKVYKTYLVDNYEGSYRSFKKVQSFILNSVQDVYKSQGVSINNKHLEVIIKQMTTKVLITYEGKTPLLRREIIDLYHAYYINKITQKYNKKISYYIPLLLGITKAALNNPSFISAASFQETTRVLTQAAIEGRIDWLKGLKENIILGRLIPTGTGACNYRYAFGNSKL